MKHLLKYPILIFVLLIIFNSKVQAASYCSSADFVTLYNSSLPCNEKKLWAPHFKKYQSSIKLNAHVYRLMSDINRKVVKENKNELIAKIPKGYCEADGGWVPCDWKKRAKKINDEDEKRKKIEEKRKKMKDAKVIAIKKGNENWISENKDKYLDDFKAKFSEYSKKIQKFEDERKNLKIIFDNYKNLFDTSNKNIEIAFDDLANINKEIKDKKKEIRENKKIHLSEVTFERFEDRLKEISKINFKKYDNYKKLKEIIKKAEKSNSAKDFVGKKGLKIQLPIIAGGGRIHLTSNKMGFIEKFEILPNKFLGSGSNTDLLNMEELKIEIAQKVVDIEDFITKPVQELVAYDNALEEEKAKYINLLKSNPFYLFYNLINQLLYDFL